MVAFFAGLSNAKTIKKIDICGAGLELKELKENYTYLVDEYRKERETNKRLRRSLNELVDAGIKYISSTHSIDWNDGSRETQFKEVLDTGKKELNGTNCDV